jgi:NAD(P)-dependent dehydrogenase (short-subunit alcohol dehydrogenase family)
MAVMTRIALITGANRGIGRATALQLARDGVDVIVTYRSHAEEAARVVEEITALGRTAVALPLDVADSSSFDAFADAVRAALPAFGRETFDHLVNNAGFSRGGTIADVTEADVDALIDVHFKGVLFLTQKLLPLLADGGSIVNLSSGLARFTGPQRAAYGAVKGAVEVLTRYMAAELGPRAITANVIAPGPVATDFSGGLVRDNAEVREHLVAMTPLGRYAVAEDIGGAIAALLAPENRWVTGQRIEVAGGIHL